MRNKADMVYEVEKKFMQMMEQNMPYEQMNRELNIIRKYSYKEYMTKNIQLLHKDSKMYHKCL
jgi:hypothetical protein